jgi:hypothetical protein
MIHALVIRCRYRTAVMRCIVFVVLLATFSCSNSSDVIIHYIIPDGYRGLFVIRDVSGARQIERVDGIYEIIVPPDGEVIVRSSKVLSRWHRYTASYYSGTQLPKDGVNLYCLSVYSDGRTYCLIGTEIEKEMAAHISLRHIPLGRPLTYEDLPEYAKNRFKPS